MTPPATMLCLNDNGEIKKAKDPLDGERPKNWLVRCIPNLYPAFSPPKQPQDETQFLKSECFSYAIGHHEVIVEFPNHEENLADAELHQIERIIYMYIDRLRELSAKPYVKYVSIFKNYGQQAGASLTHPHSQLIATPIVPVIIQEELDASKAFYSKQGRCIFCDIIEQESQSPRLVCEDSDFVVFAPYASISQMEFWIMPKKHSASILDLDDAEVSAFAKTLKTSLKALKDAANNPPYNFGFHLAINKEAQNYYHWHLEVHPKLAIWAGFEITTGVYLNTMTPEAAAGCLRKALKS